MLYLDMDGVLMDYDSHVAGWLQPLWNGRVYHNLPESEWTEEEATNDRRYKDAMADQTFWRTMKPMADAHLLWGFARTLEPRILTATPHGATYAARCATDKLHTIHQHFDPVFPAEHFHAVLRSDKRLLAKQGHILVDDMAPNCADWEAAGGTAILHKNALTTIRILQEVFHGR